MSRTLTVVSPLATGEDVKEAQRLLGHNVFGQDFQPGPVDGQFGQATGRACIRAKFWLGYPTRKQLPSFGDELRGYLEGTALPIGFAKSRQDRLDEGQGTVMRAQALTKAKQYLGVKESPAGSNHNPFGVWYGADHQPWCAMFVSFCYAAVGSKAFAKRVHYAYVPYIVHDARAGANGLAVTSDPKPGDLVCYDWQGNGVADHVGLFEKWTRGDAFNAIEGNTAVGNDSNGGEVMRRERHRSQVQVFVHVGR